MTETSLIPSSLKTFTLALKDSFQNFTAALGIGTNNLLTQGTYALNPITRNRLKLEQMYRGSWLCAAAVDLTAEDMCRESIDIQGLDIQDQENIHNTISEFGMWASYMSALKWGRLYGGSILYIMIDGQDPSTELNIDSIQLNQFKGLMVLDRWQIMPSMTEFVTELGPDYGLPLYYDVISDRLIVNTNTRIHHSRVIRFVGHELPHQQRIAEMGWGQSVLERINDRVIAFDSTHTGIAQLVFKAHLRIMKIKNLRQIVAQEGPAKDALVAQMQMMRNTQSNEGISLIDFEDELEAQSYGFGGLAELLDKFGEQVSGAIQTPVTRLFGSSPGGLNATGDSDITTYYDNLEKQREMRLRNSWHKLLKILSYSCLGKPLDATATFKFRSLYVMKDNEKADIVQKLVTAIIDTFNARIIDKQTALKELRKLGTSYDIFALIPDEHLRDEFKKASEEEWAIRIGDGRASKLDYFRDQHGLSDEDAYAKIAEIEKERKSAVPGIPRVVRVTEQD